MSQLPLQPPFRTDPVKNHSPLAGIIGSTALPGVFLGGVIGFMAGGEKHAITGALLGWGMLAVMVYMGKKNKK